MRSCRTRTGQVAVALSLAVAGLAAWKAYSSYDRTWLANGPENGNKSIAVLPFENLSADPENAFFALGVQDEILGDLAKIADLKVISRTSVMRSKTGVNRNLRDIAPALGVSHVVEGSAQRTRNHVRARAQLIDARTDTHVSAEQYDGELADAFAFQSEIAQKIADQLQAKISPGEKAEIAKPPTMNLAAFHLYLQAQTLWADASDPIHGKENLPEAARLLNDAVTRDPNFFLASCFFGKNKWCTLSTRLRSSSQPS